MAIYGGASWWYGNLRLRAFVYDNRAALMRCPLRPRCTTHHSRILRVEGEDALDRMAARLTARPEVLDQRRMSVEHPFGSIKQWMNQGTFLMRRRPNVQGELSLTAPAYNIRRAISLLGVPKLMLAVRGQKASSSRSCLQCGHETALGGPHETSYAAIIKNATRSVCRTSADTISPKQRSFHTVSKNHARPILPEKWAGFERQACRL